MADLRVQQRKSYGSGLCGLLVRESDSEHHLLQCRMSGPADMQSGESGHGMGRGLRMRSVSARLTRPVALITRNGSVVAIMESGGDMSRGDVRVRVSAAERFRVSIRIDAADLHCHSKVFTKIKRSFGSWSRANHVRQVRGRRSAKEVCDGETW